MDNAVLELETFFSCLCLSSDELQACATVCVCSSLKTVSQEPSPSPGASPSLHPVLGPGLAATCILSFSPPPFFQSLLLKDRFSLAGRKLILGNAGRLPR